MHQRTKRLVAIAAGALTVATVAIVGAAVARADDRSSGSKDKAGVAEVRTVSTALAQQAAQAAFDACSEQGHRVTVSVVGRDGALLALVRNEQAGPASVDSATGKAYASVSFRAPSGNLGEAAKNNPGLLQMPKFVVLRGGLPINSSGEVIGAIGVGGAPSGDLDEACAKVGLDSINGNL
jgi:uncharacterized protein GlcG (DUF336 family)